MRAGVVVLVVAAALSPWSARDGRAQVLRDLPPVELEYSLYRWLLVNLQGGSEFRWFFRTRYAF